jgi:hypothetical protein
LMMMLMILIIIIIMMFLMMMMMMMMILMINFFVWLIGALLQKISYDPSIVLMMIVMMKII